jgi:DNA-binding IclR family transcriptional regulator
MFCFVAKLGYRIGVYCSAPGKAMLAVLPDKELTEVIEAIKFHRYNERTIMTKEELRIELKRAVKNGYAFDNAEQFEGVYCTAAPIFDRSGYPVAAIWATGLMMDIKRKDVPALGVVIREHADRISARLGYMKRGA